MPTAKYENPCLIYEYQYDFYYYNYTFDNYSFKDTLHQNKKIPFSKEEQN